MDISVRDSSGREMSKKERKEERDNVERRRKGVGKRVSVGMKSKNEALS